MSGRHSRTKGANFERLVARNLREDLPNVNVIRHGETQRADDTVPDVQAVGVVAVECKHHAKYPNIYKELETATERRSTGEWAVAITKADRQPAVVAMYLEDWRELLHQWYLATRPNASSFNPTTNPFGSKATIDDALDALEGTILEVLD